jgi:hypothetical protein
MRISWRRPEMVRERHGGSRYISRPVQRRRRELWAPTWFSWPRLASATSGRRSIVRAPRVWLGHLLLFGAVVLGPSDMPNAPRQDDKNKTMGLLGGGALGALVNISDANKSGNNLFIQLGSGPALTCSRYSAACQAD